jgi:hypothetical protein
MSLQHGYNVLWLSPACVGGSGGGAAGGIGGKLQNDFVFKGKR